MDTICGHQARAYAVLDGRVEPMFYAKELRAVVVKDKARVNVLGRRGALYKTAGWSGSGKMVMYYSTSLFRRMMADYIKEGRDVSFDIQVINEDTAGGSGRQTVVLRGVNLNRVVMASFDARAQVLEEEMDFTFDDVDVLEGFKPSPLGTV